MEWRVFFGRGASERRTAVVQICDLRTILIIQISAMKGTILYRPVFHENYICNYDRISFQGQGNAMETKFNFPTESACLYRQWWETKTSSRWA